MEEGERMVLWCHGGPLMARVATYPPPVELEVPGGAYVLIDDGPPEGWAYEFVATL